MPEIKSFNLYTPRKGNPLKVTIESFNSMSKFTRFMVISFFLLILSTPFIVNNPQIFKSKAQKLERVYSDIEVSKIINKNEELLQGVGFKEVPIVDSCPSIPIKETIEKPDTNRVNKQNDTNAVSDLTHGLTESSNAYKSALEYKKPQLKNQVNKLTRARKSLFMQLMRSDPDAALSLAISSSKQDELKAISGFPTNCVETGSSVEGELEILHADFFEDNLSVNQYTLVTPDRKRIRLHPAKGTDKLIISGMRLKINGYRLDDDILFDTKNPDNLNILPPGKSSSNPFVKEVYADHNAYHTQIQQDARGEQKIVVLKTIINSGASSYYTNDQINDLVFRQINNYYIENSYGKINIISGDIFPQKDEEPAWYNLNLPLSDCSNSNVILDRAINKADPNVNFSNYNGMIILTEGCGSGGLGSIGKVTLPITVDGIGKMSVSWIFLDVNPNNSVFIIGHEFGHNLGLDHANFLSCVRATIRPTGCSKIEYGDIYDVMGKAPSYRNQKLVHMNVFNKEYLGWFDLSNISTSTANGSYTIEPIETATSGLKALKIARGNNDFLFIEYRQPIGFDGTSLAGDAFLGGLLHKIDAGFWSAATSYILDLTPSDLDFYPNLSQPALSVGNSFTDYASGATVAVKSKSESALVVDVAFGALDIAVSSVSILSDNPAVGDGLSFEAIVKNNGVGKVEINTPLRLHIDENSNDTWDYTNDITQANALNSNASETKTWTNVSTAIQGTHKVEVCADPDNIIAESDNTNNCMTKIFAVGVSPTPIPIPPTLTILDPDLSNNGLVDQADVDIVSAAFLSQKGDANYKIEYDLKPDGVINISDFGIISVNSALAWPPTNLSEGRTLKFYVIGSDPDGDALTLSATSLPSGATFDPTTGLFNWIPTFYQAGSFNPSFTVSDGSLQDSETLPITVVDVPRPDLLVSSVSTLTTVMYPGGNISVPHSVKNQGTASASGIINEFHLSTDAAYGGVDDIPFVNKRSISSLLAGATSTVSSWVMAIPSTTLPGNYYICGMADMTNTNAEEDETNNSRCTSSTIKIAYPDLTVTSLSGPSTANTGTNISIPITIVNQGEGPSKAVDTGIYLSKDSTITTSDTRISTLGLGSGLAPGATKTTTISGNVMSTLTPGTYYLGAIADYNGKVKETNETNNTFLDNQITVTPGADLVITLVSGPTTASPGTSVTISTTTKNQGLGSTGSSTTGIYLSTDSTITTTDIRIGTRSISSLAINQTSSGTATITLPSTLISGVYYLGAIADYANLRIESNETNNTLIGNTITVQ